MTADKTLLTMVGRRACGSAVLRLVLPSDVSELRRSVRDETNREDMREKRADARARLHVGDVGAEDRQRGAMNRADVLHAATCEACAGLRVPPSRDVNSNQRRALGCSSVLRLQREAW